MRVLYTRGGLCFQTYTMQFVRMEGQDEALGKKLNKATRMEMEKEPEMKEFKNVNDKVVVLDK